MKMNLKKRVQLAIHAQAAADRSVAAIDDALAFVAASNSRIDAISGQNCRASGEQVDISHSGVTGADGVQLPVGL